MAPWIHAAAAYGAGAFLAVVACVLALVSVTLALCAKHDQTRGSAKHGLVKTFASKKFLLSRKWRRSDEEEALDAYDRAVMEEGEDLLWQRNILMGEKCQPLNFSGTIIYDEKGNRLPESPPRSPKITLCRPPPDGKN